VLLVAAACVAIRGEAQVRSMRQDSSVNNLAHAPGIALARSGTLGRIRTMGTGPRTMVLIAGMGFGDQTWDEFAKPFEAEYTMYAVTLPGFGGTAPLPLPPEPARFGTTPWIQSSIDAIRTLVDSLGRRDVVLVAHWAVATQIGLRLAIELPDRFTRLVLLSGSLRLRPDAFPGMRLDTPALRRQTVEGMASQWFRTVTRRTWDDNNFMPYDYAMNPRRGLWLWREAAEPGLTVWVRYMLEYYATDLTPDLPRLRVPTLVILPDFDDPTFYVDDPRNNYMRQFVTASWKDVALPDLVQQHVVHGTRLFVHLDKPAEVQKLVREFLRHDGAQRGARRNPIPATRP
jgi:pimeloyl-ACP methyl ester carboxylesterase